jgi:alpha-beta hydrolase superfamily lysophospholipase
LYDGAMSTPSSLSRRILRYVAWCAAVAVVLAAVGFSGIVFAWTRFAQSLPELHGWHVDAPRSEFHAADATDTYTFDDYIKQENRVFAELDVLVASKWAGEKAGRFCRYKADSVCNPRTLFERNWNRTYLLEAPTPIGGVLLVHGLSDSPYSLRALGEQLHRAGYTVIGLRVPGHGTCPKALADASWDDWAASVRVAMKGLRDRVPAGKPLIMVGYSNGGALCVNYVASSLEGGNGGSPGADAMVLISPMIGISPMAEFTQLYPTVARLSGERKLAWSGVEPEIDPFKYSSWPTNASLQAHLVTQKVEQSLAALAADGRMARFPPVLTVQSVVDSTVVAYRMIDVLMDRLPPGTSELILFDVRRDELIEGLIDCGFEQHIRPRLTRGNLPFALTFVTARSPASEELVARTYRGAEPTEAEVGVAWPQGVFSLSHVALPIPPSDPVYGPGSPDAPAKLPLGKLSLRGESGVLALSPTLLMRMRYNPFYDWTEKRILTWIEARTRK